MLWIVYCVPKPDIAEVRAAASEAHSSYLKSKEHMIFFSGQMLTDDGNGTMGNVFIIYAKTRAEAQAFSDGEGYTRAGVFESVRITRMKRGRFKPELLELVPKGA